jgi:hypothetical protein
MGEAAGECEEGLVDFVAASVHPSMRLRLWITGFTLRLRTSRPVLVMVLAGNSEHAPGRDSLATLIGAELMPTQTARSLGLKRSASVATSSPIHSSVSR